MKKRYSAVDLTDLAIGIIVLGIAVTIGATILLNVRDARLTDLAILTTANETGVVLNSSSGAHTLVNIWGKSVSDCYCNQSGAGFLADCGTNSTLGSVNYTVSISSGGTIGLVNATNSTYNDVKCTYDYYDTTRADWALPNDAAIGIAEFGNWFDIIIIVGIAGLILALIFMAFGNRGGQDQGVVY